MLLVIELLNPWLTNTQRSVAHQLGAAVDSSKGVATSTNKTLSVIDTGSSILAWGTDARGILPCDRERKTNNLGHNAITVTLPKWLSVQKASGILLRLCVEVNFRSLPALFRLFTRVASLFTWAQHNLRQTLQDIQNYLWMLSSCLRASHWWGPSKHWDIWTSRTAHSKRLLSTNTVPALLLNIIASLQCEFKASKVWLQPSIRKFSFCCSLHKSFHNNLRQDRWPSGQIQPGEHREIGGWELTPPCHSMTQRPDHSTPAAHFPLPVDHGDSTLFVLSHI